MVPATASMGLPPVMILVAAGMADLVAGLACLLAVVDLQVGCRQVEVARLLHVSRLFLLLRAELIIVLYELHPFLILLKSPSPPASPHSNNNNLVQPTLCTY